MSLGGPRVAAITALALGGCAALPLGDAPKIVQGLPLPSYQIFEECFALKEGDRVEYRFESTEPVDFNLHYHEGGAVVMPVSHERSREAAGVYAVQIGEDYCLMWEAGAAGAVIDYRFRVRPPDS
jgi:hypothetical protein